MPMHALGHDAQAAVKKRAVAQRGRRPLLPAHLALGSMFASANPNQARPVPMAQPATAQAQPVSAVPIAGQPKSIFNP